jgi:DNA-directed RNA polymerase alpha subunit
MSQEKQFTAKEAKVIGEKLGIDWKEYDVEQFRMGLDVELEHGMISPKTNVTNDDPILTAKIALAHLNEFPDYYTRLEVLEEEADAALKKRKKGGKTVQRT